MLNFKQAKENTMKGIGEHSTLITFMLTALGVGATIYFASKEIPKAEKEVKEILAKEDLTKKQKVVESGKTIVKTTWKTFVVALGTVLLVTGTNAITVANSAATVAGMTNTIGMLEQRVKDYQDAVEEIPNKKVKEEVKNNVIQKRLDRVTESMKPEDFEKSPDTLPDVYLWIDTYTGAQFWASYQLLDTVEEIIDNRIRMDSYQTIFDFYEVLVKYGAKFVGESYPQMCEDHAWTHCIGLDPDVKRSNDHDIHYITYSEPTMDF